MKFLESNLKLCSCLRTTAATAGARAPPTWVGGGTRRESFEAPSFCESAQEAAEDLGASPVETFVLVTLPIILPGVIAAALLAFALSLDDYVITSFVAGNTQTFPLWVYGATRLGVPPQVNVIGTFIFLGGCLISISFAAFRTWRNRQQLREATAT